MYAFHNDPAVKAAYLGRVEAHRKADEIRQSYGYWRENKGCAVGCTVHHDDDAHIQYEKQLGIPSVIAHIQDRLFELMPNARAMTWPSEFLGAIPVGADLSLVWPRFAVWLLVDPTYGVIRYAQAEQQVVIEEVATLYQIVINGGTVDTKTWGAAAGGADAAYYDAYYDADATDAAAAAAVIAADTAYYAAYYAAYYDTDAAAAAGAADAACTAYYGYTAYAEIMADQLLALLAAAPLLLQEEG